MKPLAGRRVLVAMSGGVDSSAAAALLIEQGAEVVGATTKNFCFAETDELPGRSCCSVDAVAAPPIYATACCIDGRLAAQPAEPASRMLP